MGEIAAVGWLVAAFFAASWWMVRSDSNKAIETLIESRNYYRDQFEAMKKKPFDPRVGLTPQQQAPKRPPVLNSAAARAAIDRSNAPYFSAEKRIPNSEVLKEQENG